MALHCHGQCRIMFRPAHVIYNQATMGEICHVCGQAADQTNSAICNSCDRRFHLRLREDSEGPECGRVWINEQFLSLEYACNICLGESEDSAEPAIGRRH